jgi:adenosine deaminase
MRVFTVSAQTQLRGLPKAEVHVHLEGCFEPETIERLALKAGVRLPRPRDNLLRFADLADFLSFLDWSCGLVRTEDQLTEAAYAFGRRMAASGAGYADIIVNPTHWTHWHLRIGEMIEALDRGFSAAEHDGLPPVGLCVSLLRSQTAAAAAELVDLLIARRHPRVVALSIDGNEAKAGRTGPRFAEAFRRAGAAGLKRTVHAGESSGPEGVRDAIELLGADRIDHGVRAIEDADLVALLAKRRIALGVCPTSNTALGLYASMAEHPLDRLRRAGVAVSVNTDDPCLLGTTLPDEYARCVDAYGWGKDELRAVARTSIEASFADAETKARLMTQLQAW